MCMKLKSLLITACLLVVPASFANNLHFNPKVTETEKQSMANNLSAPGPCQIEIINDSSYDLMVYGRFDNDLYLVPFLFKYWGAPQYVTLFYNNFCHFDRSY